jgi:cytidylate kinase
VLDVKKLVGMLGGISVDIGPEGVILDGEAVGDEIYSIEVSNHVSAVSSVPEVRAKLVVLQREAGRRRGVVMEGRDIGTVVFPDAELKIFLTADPAVRARRRWKDMPDIPLDDIERNIRERDNADAGRESSPLRKADDALVLDNSDMTLEEQVEWVMDKLRMMRARTMDN